jgi:hypothetical protein
MRCLIIVLLLIPLVWAADQPMDKPLPSDAQKVVEARDAEVAKAKAIYDAAVTKANGDAVKKLEPLLVKITKAGDLDGANSVKAKVDEFKGDQADLLGDANPANNAFPAGKWTVPDAPPGKFFLLNADKTWSSNYKVMAGTWIIQKNKLVLTSTAGNNQTFSVPLLKESDWVFNNGTATERMRWEPTPKVAK